VPVVFLPTSGDLADVAFSTEMRSNEYCTAKRVVDAVVVYVLQIVGAEPCILEY
jgi:hypothetical protein